MCEYMLEVSPKMLRAPVSVWWVSLGGECGGATPACAQRRRWALKPLPLERSIEINVCKINEDLLTLKTAFHG